MADGGSGISMVERGENIVHLVFFHADAAVLNNYAVQCYCNIDVTIFGIEDGFTYQVAE